MTRSARSTRMLTVAGIILLAIAVSVAAVFLGRWQWHRHEARSDELHAFTTGQAAEAVPLAQVIPASATQFPDAARWRNATVTGSFATDTLTWLRNRPVDGTPATHALAWFVTDDGRALLVDAGWVGAEEGDRPTLPSGSLSLTVTLRPAEQDDGKRGDGATRITPEQMPAAPATEVPGYGVLSQACQDPCGPLPGLAITPLPELSLGPHLSYTVQWYLLAIAAPIIAIVWIRRELGGAPSGVAPPRPGRRTRGPSDEEIEDAL